MKLVENDNKDAGGVHLPFDAAMAALASGAYEAHPIEGERGPDQPAAQSPKPGTDPVGGKEEAGPDTPLTNLTPTGLTTSEAPGLPKEPAPTPATAAKVVVPPAKVDVKAPADK